MPRYYASGRGGMTESNLSLITLSFQSGPYIDRCLGSLLDQEAHEVIHADNGSNDIDLDELRSDYPAVHQVRNGANLGFAAGMNRAAAVATGDWLAFINPDAFADPDWLNEMRIAVESHPDTAIFTSLQIDARNAQRLDGAGDSLTFFGFPYRAGFGRPLLKDSHAREVFSPCGAAFAIRRSLFLELEGFDRRFFCYCEDADLGFRARLMGENCRLVPEAMVAHVGSASTAKRSNFALYHGYRNRLWLYAKNMPLMLLIPTLPFHIGMTLLVVVVDILKGNGRIVWKGLHDGVMGMGPILVRRKKIQSGRRISALRLAKVLTWNPWKIVRRQ